MKRTKKRVGNGKFWASRDEYRWRLASFISSVSNYRRENALGSPKRRSPGMYFPLTKPRKKDGKCEETTGETTKTRQKVYRMERNAREK